MAPNTRSGKRQVAESMKENRRSLVRDADERVVSRGTTSRKRKVRGSLVHAADPPRDEAYYQKLISKGAHPRAAEIMAVSAAKYQIRMAPTLAKDKERREQPPPGLIAVNQKIPNGILKHILPTPPPWGTIEMMDVHSHLAGKKVILYGLPGYLEEYASDTMPIDCVPKLALWLPFFKSRVMEPTWEFIDQAEGLKAKGVDEIIFVSFNMQMRMVARTCPKCTKYEFVKVATDVYGGVNSYDGAPNDDSKSFIYALGIHRDIQQEGRPPRSRRFMVLVDNLEVKYVNVESSDENFTVPSAVDIVKAFG
ncbi:hypothetical protein IFM89_018075 [Coptis chinensis]|uniref:Uncharacterized protein n=1 Tax=Coptis chinensis TaxID=261450 RepID=A0A835IDC8_9MAGN|nr:hypothetical protein IFM89_018075 [Coptis chinensis]